MFINNPGLHSFVMKSKKKQDAKGFKKLVWSEVIHAIRKRETYSRHEHCSDDDDGSVWSEDHAVGREEDCGDAQPTGSSSTLTKLTAIQKWRASW